MFHLPLWDLIVLYLTVTTAVKARNDPFPRVCMFLVTF